ncbi:MAG: Fe-S cluster assembly protein SufD, partial [Simkaniaceae bacterium]|nr:Fe-S cluster assembly protein SufD [Simkaniaceae bacterium]
AHVNANPQLEIYADDVACSHGSTTGELDDDALFYLRSRGINREAAQALMISGFASEVIENITNENIRNEFNQRLNNWLAEGE